MSKPVHSSLPYICTHRLHRDKTITKNTFERKCGNKRRYLDNQEWTKLSIRLKGKSYHRVSYSRNCAIQKYRHIMIKSLEGPRREPTRSRRPQRSCSRQEANLSTSINAPHLHSTDKEPQYFQEQKSQTSEPKGQVNTSWHVHSHLSQLSSQTLKSRKYRKTEPTENRLWKSLIRTLTEVAPLPC